jgi:hypothetical protein
MSHYYGVPFAELHLDKAQDMLRCEFRNHNMVAVPAREGLNGLFDAVLAQITENGVSQMMKEEA